MHIALWIRKRTTSTNFFHPVGVNESSLKDFALLCESSALFSAAMPTLPSGRNVAINFQHLEAASQRAFHEEDESLLVRLDHPSEMFRLIELADVEFRSDIPCAELDRMWSEDGDKYGILHPLSCCISRVIRNETGWSGADIVGLKHFLMRDSVRRIFRMWRKDIAGLRSALTARASDRMPLTTRAATYCEETGPSWHF
jgi:hypothetical protein